MTCFLMTSLPHTLKVRSGCRCDDFINIGYIHTPFFLPRYGPVSGVMTTLPSALAYSSLASLGVTVGSCTIIWSVISSDALCDGTKSTGTVIPK